MTIQATANPERHARAEQTDTLKRRIAAVIPAAGQARRFGSGENKIWAKIGGISVLERTLTAFCTYAAFQLVVVVTGEEEIARVQDLAARSAGQWTVPLQVIAGGVTRTDSVKNGLDSLSPDTEIVLVHDAARPLVTHALIDRIVAAATRRGAAVPGLPLSDTVKRMDSLHLVRATIPRSVEIDGEVLSGLIAVQTPQGAAVAQLRTAYSRYDFSASEPTDEASLIEAMGGQVEIVPGDPVNIKITVQEDIQFAERLLSEAVPPPSVSSNESPATSHPTQVANHQSPATNYQPPVTNQHPPETRIGFGYDVHAFASPATGRKLFLGGIEIPHDRGLEGHSDADVLLHAVCDALLGALSLGDIGILFPNTDDSYKGIKSIRLLQIVNDLVQEAGWTILNIDATVVAEAPKLMPHRLEMQRKIADSLGIDPGRVSIKATTSESMGFVGRKEGMASWAVATLREEPSE